MYDQHRRWKKKFADAFRGLREGVRGQNSFLIHLPATVVVLVIGVWLHMTIERLALLVLCISGVLVAEYVNSAIEWLARAITSEHDERIRNALDIASGAVLMASISAMAVGALLLVHSLGMRFGWW